MLRSERRERRSVTLLSWLIIGLLSSGCAPHGAPESGAVVVNCDRGEAADLAGLEPGDTILGWRQGTLSGTVESPFHLALVEQERAPYGQVELRVRRGLWPRRIVIPTGRWRVEVRPMLDRRGETAHLQAQRRLEAAEPESAAEEWLQLASASSEDGLELISAWYVTQGTVALAGSDRRGEIPSLLEAAAGTIDDLRLRAAFWERAGDELLGTGQNMLAAEAFGSAVTILEEVAPKSPLLAFALLQRGRTDLRGCGPDAARALEIYESVDPRTVETATALNQSAVAAYYRSDLDTAEQKYLSALEVVQTVVGDGPFTCEILGNLGLVALKRGDFASAERYFRHDLEAASSLGTNTTQYSYAANYLGLLAKNTGRYEDARRFYEQALRSFEAARPGGVEVAGVLTNLGNVSIREERYDTAFRFHREALEIRRRIDPESNDVASSLHNLGMVARLRREYAPARAHLEQALAIKRRGDPGSMWTATTEFELAEVARGQGRLDEAESVHRDVLDLRRRIGPDQPDVANSLLGLGSTVLDLGRPAEAETLWREALDLIEGRRSLIPGAEDEKSRFGSMTYSYRGILARLLLDQGRTIEAWNVLERARAGALRATVARRGAVPASIPSDLWFAKTATEARIARTERRLAHVSPERDEERLLRYRADLEEARNRLSEILDEIGRAAPRFTEFSATEAHTVEELGSILDPGTLVLTYTIGQDHAYLLAARSNSDGEVVVRPFRLATDTFELRNRVDTLRTLTDSQPGSADEMARITTESAALFNLLLEPARKLIATAERVLIIPDGPLVDLPFAALALPDRPGLFFGQWRPLFYNPSASLLAELTAHRRAATPGSTTIAAFGDPLYPTEAPYVARYGLRQLEGSKIEIGAIERLFPDKATTFLRASATEANFKTHAPRARLLHLAVHARADSYYPMSSALFFSPPEKSAGDGDDGVVWAWEIMDELVVESNVVVLSACSTGAGRVVKGEGVISLARAFQYAGAHTLVAAQWEVPDRSTAKLMTRFYTHLQTGLNTAESLMRAQREVAEADPDTAHPYHWAAFQVTGDWR
jgi:CHAT domain-containing protein/Tfp pilus assembly protein PilF